MVRRPPAFGTVLMPRRYDWIGSNTRLRPPNARNIGRRSRARVALSAEGEVVRAARRLRGGLKMVLQRGGCLKAAGLEDVCVVYAADVHPDGALRERRGARRAVDRQPERAGRQHKAVPGAVRHGRTRQLSRQARCGLRTAGTRRVIVTI
jgi:hypothetical protein